MTYSFTTTSADNIQGVRTPKTSKYSDLVEACMTLTPGNGIQVPFDDDDDPVKMRINIANAVRNKVIGAWQSQGFDYRLRVVRCDGYIGILCIDDNDNNPQPKKATPKKRNTRRK